MEPTICRVCMVNQENMVNIFSKPPNSRVSIDTIISEWCGQPVVRDDIYSKLICPSCLLDAQNEYTNGYHEEDHSRVVKSEDEVSTNVQVVQESLARNVFEEDMSDNLVDENQVMEESHQAMNEPLGRDVFEEDMSDNVVDENQAMEESDQAQEDSYEDQFPSLVMNEPLTGDVFETEYPPYTESDLFSEVKIEDNWQLEYNFETSERDISDNGVDENHNVDNDNNAGDDVEEPFTCILYPESDLSELEMRYPFGCPHCEKTFTNKAGLGGHLRIHNRNRTLECSHCMSTFTRPGNLKRHMLIHSRDQSFKCSVCSKNFRSKQFLNIHKRIHMKDRSLQGSNLKVKIQKLKDDRSFQCSHCPSTFKTDDDLKRHLQKCKGKCQQAFDTKYQIKTRSRSKGARQNRI
ncbi:zinc finger protein 26-like isoform X2 [Drosophila eugracilis]|uniref:zinc finger protein 26-like isoform X2 n=1 Tax=Drosophila eugracilis TaxID=29029 RepID=UPI0007E7B142|nr:zinc finger protein 26-like isoform X2 [Drosophila eugracilis]